MAGTSKKRKAPIKSASAIQSYTRVTLFLSVALMALIFVQFNIAQKQKNMLLITYMTERQMVLQGNILAAMAAFQKNADQGLIQSIRDSATEAQSLEALVLPLMAQTTWFSMPAIRYALFEKFREMTVQGMSFAAYAESGQMGNAADIARDIRTMHAAGIPDNWREEVRSYIEAVQTEVDGLVYASYVLYVLLIGCLLFQALAQVLPLMQEAENLRTQIKDMAATDMLTGIYNRAMLFKLGNMLMSAAQRHKQALTMMVINVDNFEALNNKYGRAASDHMLRLLAEEMAVCLRSSDVLGRFGGDEFAVCLPATDEYRALYVAEKLRAAAEGISYVWNDQQIMLTVSIGVAEIQKMHTTPDDMLRAAQAALQKAKSEGRNRCFSYSEIEEAAPAVVL